MPRGLLFALLICFGGALPLCAWQRILSGDELPSKPCAPDTLFYLQAGTAHYYRCENRSWVATDPKTARIFDVRREGATGNGSSDDQRPIVAAMRAASAHGGIVFFPPGTYLHGNVIDVGSNTQVVGVGVESVLVDRDFPNTALRFRNAANSSVSDLKFTSRANTRLSTADSADILFESSQNCSVSRVTIDGAPSVGIMVRSSSEISVDHNDVSNTMADGIHVVDGSHDIQVTNNAAHNTGDDSFAAVAYRASPQTDSVLIENNVSVGSHARGVSCIGAAHCLIRNNQIEAPRAHGIAVAYEQVFNTWRPSAAKVEHNSVRQVHNPVMNPLLIAGADGVDVDDLQIDDSTEVYCFQSSHVSLTRLNITNAIGVAIGALDCNDFSVTDSHISGAAKNAIRVEGIRKGDFSRNVLTDLFRRGGDGTGGIDVFRSEDVTGSGNTASRGMLPLRVVSCNACSVKVQQER